MAIESGLRAGLSGKERSSEKSPARYWLIAFILISILGIASELYLTRGGPGASGDSVHYMDGARNLLAGKGYGRTRGDGAIVPITMFPPFFSIALAGFDLLGLEPFQAARYFNAVLFGINLALIGLLIYRSSRSKLASLSGVLLAFTALRFMTIHAWVMSEPLYITLTLLAFLSLTIYRKNDSRSLLILAGVIVGLAAITRHVGLSLIAAAPVWVLLFTGKGKRWNWAGAILVGIASLVPVAPWYIRDSLVSSTVGGRLVSYYPIPYAMVKVILSEFSFWAIPSWLHIDWRLGLVLFGILVAAGLVVFFRKEIARHPSGQEQQQPETDGLAALALLYVLFYALILFVDAVFLDASLDEPAYRRFLIPAFVALLIWVLVMLSRVDWSRWWKPARFGLLFAGLAILLLDSYRAVVYITDPGLVFGYTDIRRDMPELVKGLQTFSPSRPILASDYELVYFLAGRPPYAIPVAYDNVRQVANADYDQKMEQSKQMLQNGAILVITSPPGQRTQTEEILSQGLVVWQKTEYVEILISPEFLK